MSWGNLTYRSAIFFMHIFAFASQILEISNIRGCSCLLAHGSGISGHPIFFRKNYMRSSVMSRGSIMYSLAILLCIFLTFMNQLLGITRLSPFFVCFISWIWRLYGTRKYFLKTLYDNLSNELGKRYVYIVPSFFQHFFESTNQLLGI